MKRVSEFTLRIVSTQEVAMPAGARLLGVAARAGLLRLYAETDCETDAETDSGAEQSVRRFEFYPTGRPIRVEPGFYRAYVGTAHLEDHARGVLHVYERRAY